MVSLYTQIVGTLLFALSYSFIAFRIRWMPLGRITGAMVGALLLICFQIITPNSAWKAINLDTIFLLLGTMIVTVLLEREGFFRHVQKILLYRCETATTLVIRISIVAGLIAAFVTNDTCCVLLTPIVVQLCERYDLPHGPFLITLATSANVASAATATGNPQNMIISSLSGLTFGVFVAHNIVAVIVALGINTSMLILFYRRRLPAKLNCTNAQFIRAPEDTECIDSIACDMQETNHLQRKIPDPYTHIDTNPDDNCASPLNTEARSADINKDSISLNSIRIDNPSYLDHTTVLPTISVSDLNTQCSTGEINSASERKLDNNSGILENAVQHQQSNSVWFEHTSSNQILPSKIMNDPGTEERQMKKSGHFLPKTVSFAPDKAPLSISTIPIRAASLHCPRQLNRHLIMVRSSNQFDVKSDEDWVELYKNHEHTTHAQWLSRKLFHPSKLTLFSCVLLGMIAAFAAGMPLSWVSFGGAATMLALDMQEPDTTLLSVDWGLLVFFCALFIVVQGFSNTQLPNAVWNALHPYIDVKTFSGMLFYSAIVLIGSNTVSNVPLVLILGPSIPKLADPQGSWLLLAFVSTVAGNLTLVGSVANLIVAGRAKRWYVLTFSEYLRFGVPSTLIISFVGALLVWIFVK